MSQTMLQTWTFLRHSYHFQPFKVFSFFFQYITKRFLQTHHICIANCLNFVAIKVRDDWVHKWVEIVEHFHNFQRRRSRTDLGESNQITEHDADAIKTLCNDSFTVNQRFCNGPKSSLFIKCQYASDVSQQCKRADFTSEAFWVKDFLSFSSLHSTVSFVLAPTLPDYKHISPWEPSCCQKCCFSCNIEKEK